MGMGPDNMRTVQATLRAIAQAIDVPVENLAQGSVLLR